MAGPQSVQVRFDPYDLTEIQVWKDGKRQENARPLRVRSLSSDKRQEEPSLPQSPPKTGLNYVELAYEEYQRLTRREQSGTLQELVQQLEVKQG